MGRFSPCPFHFHNSNKHQEYSNQSHSQPIFHHNSSDSSNSSLSSQPSLPSVPSLTPPHPTTTANHHLVATLKGHSSYIFSLTLAGNHLYSGASDGEIRVWDRNPSSFNFNSTHNNTIAQGYSAVKSIVALNDKLITAHQDHKIRVWKLKNDTNSIPLHQSYHLYTTLPTVNDRCMTVFFAKNYVKVRRHKKSTWVHHVDTVSALALSKDGSFLYSVSWDRSFKVWRTSDFKCVESVQDAHDDAINAVVLSSDGVYVYTGSADKKIKVWKRDFGLKKHLLVSTLEKHKSAVNALALSSDGCVLYSGACDRSIIVWEKDDGGGGGGHMVVAGALRGHGKAILCLAVVSDLLCSGSADKSVRVWKKGSGNSHFCLAVFEGHKSPVKCLVAASVDSSSDLGSSYLVYSGSLDFDIKVWKIDVSV
ncbi:hypothetical protein ACJIZ3_020240 [Penstemon smallii]|uniref:Uncharacterized protein n=1 Tax=Penstemon smallii TaxID=265156 RepID=A0ABD3SI21_9LAMI